MGVVNEEDVRAIVDNIFEIGRSLAELAIGIKFNFLVLLASIQDFSIAMSSSSMATAAVRSPKNGLGCKDFM